MVTLIQIEISKLEYYLVSEDNQFKKEFEILHNELLQNEIIARNRSLIMKILIVKTL